MKLAMDEISASPASSTKAKVLDRRERLKFLAALRRTWRQKIVDSVDQVAVLEKLDEESRMSARFVFMTLMSAAIAVLGLLLSSPAVVIGAMLLSPLMGPILGAGFALVVGRCTGTSRLRQDPVLRHSPGHCDHRADRLPVAGPDGDAGNRLAHPAELVRPVRRTVFRPRRCLCDDPRARRDHRRGRHRYSFDAASRGGGLRTGNVQLDRVRRGAAAVYDQSDHHRPVGGGDGAILRFQHCDDQETDAAPGAWHHRCVCRSCDPAQHRPPPDSVGNQRHQAGPGGHQEGIPDHRQGDPDRSRQYARRSGGDSNDSDAEIRRPGRCQGRDRSGNYTW